MMTAVADPATQDHRLREDLNVGGKYTAFDNGDDTFSIIDVAVFAEVPEGAKRNKFAIGRDWQEKAILQNKAREAEGHLPPVHVYHTDESVVKPIYAGKLRLKYTRQIVYQGERIWATFGDILGIPGDVFRKIEKGFLPYRSVEIHDWDKPEIDSLALMDTDVPYFRMEMLTIGQVIKRFRKDHELFMGRPQLVKALRAAHEGPSMAILFKFSDKPKPGGPDKKATSNGDSPPDPESYGGADIKGKPVRKKDDEAKGVGFEGDGAEEPGDKKTAPGDEQSPVDNPEAADEEGVEGDMAAMGEGGEEAAPGAPAWAQEILDALKTLTDRIAPQPPEEESLEPVSGFKDNNDKETTMADQDDKNKGAKGTAAPEGGKMVQMSAADLAALVEGATLKAVAPLQQELETMKADRAKEHKAAASKSRFESAMKELEGRNIADKSKAALLRLCEIGNEDLIKDTVEGLKVTAPLEPSPDVDTFESSLASGGTPGSTNHMGVESDDAVQKFCSKNPGPDAARFVKEEVAKFNDWKKQTRKSGATDMSMAEWLDTNWRAKNMHRTNKI